MILSDLSSRVVCLAQGLEMPADLRRAARLEASSTGSMESRAWAPKPKAVTWLRREVNGNGTPFWTGLPR